MGTRVPQSIGAFCTLPKRRFWLQSAANGFLIDSQASPAALLCSAARYCLFRGKILRDIFTCLGLVCADNREGGEKSALLRGQSLGRMRSRRGNSLPPDTGNGSDAFKLQGLVPCIFFVQSSALREHLPNSVSHG